jgi:methylmalonyl-CoA/ethylmalonyl-CoA epimerase
VALPLDHIGVVVRDIDAALPFYLERAGLAVIGREEQPDVAVRVAYLGGAGAVVQLLEPTGPGAIRDHLEAHGEGVHHLCFAVPDLEAALPVMAPGAEVAIRRGGLGRRACFLPGLHGALRVELTEVPPGGDGAEAF